MSSKFWISKISASKQQVVGALERLPKAVQAQVDFFLPSHKYVLGREGAKTFWLAEIDGKTYLTSFKTYSFPSLSRWLAEQCATEVSTVDWNDQEGFLHYSKFASDRLVCYLTSVQEEFLEYYGLECLQSAEAQKNVKKLSTLSATDTEDIQSVLDDLTSDFEYWELFDELMGEDGEFKHCTTAQVVFKDFELVQVASVDYKGKLLPWTMVSERIGNSRL